MKIVPDTSVIISGVLLDTIEKENLKAEVIIPEFVVEELRAQASKGRDIGFQGLEQLKLLRKSETKLTRIGRRQTYEEIQLAKYGRIDALIMDVAKEEKAILYTADMVQALAAEAEGIEVRYFEPYEKTRELTLDSMLTDDTMSLHLKEDIKPLAKKGKPGNFKLVPIGKPLKLKDLNKIAKEIMDAARYEKDSFIEMGGHTATVIQLGNKRIVITRPPFSEAMEITVVKPTIKAHLDDYNLSQKLLDRLADKSKGILIAGPPGSGKSTFAAALAEFYERQDNIVKTIESPRDLQVGKEITQYAKLRGNFVDTADMLLLVRPDYTVFDEVRKTEEFQVFSDMRLAGIGMIGVVHATDPIDSIQRFMDRVELGMIPHITDTVIHISKGKIEKVYDINLRVRTPTGMTEKDLARPIVEVRNFENNDLEYEIYTYGDEKVVIPVNTEETNKVNKLAEQQVLTRMKKYDKNASVTIENNKAIVKVDNDVIARIIGKQGTNIKKLEQELGIGIDIEPSVKTLGKEVPFNIEETGAYFILTFKKMSDKIINIYIGEQYLMSATVGKTNSIRVTKNSDIGKELMNGVLHNNVRVFA